MQLSRHARNNIRLYKISKTEIASAVESPDEKSMEAGKYIVLKRFPKKFSGYPLKVVYIIKVDDIMVITAYPLKKKDWR